MKAERGLTLLETAVVIATISLLMGAAVASLGGFMAQKTLAGWSESIVNDIRSAQQQSIARRSGATMTFTNGTPPGYATSVGGSTLRSQVLPGELTITPATVEFNALGVPASAVTLALTDPRNGKSITISVAPVTGAVTVQ